MEVTSPDVKSDFADLQVVTLISQFNGFWLKLEELYEWVYSSWKTKCDLYLCSKEFFIFHFETQQERDKVLNEGSLFWGRDELFVTQWFSGFDAKNMVVTMSMGKVSKPSTSFLESSGLGGHWKYPWQIQKKI